MKRNCIFTILFTIMLLVATPVKALSSCSYDEQVQLNSDVANIKVVYEEKTAEYPKDSYGCPDGSEDCTSTYDYFEMSILNMTEDFYVVVKNNIDNEEHTYTYADSKDGVIKFNWEGIMNIATFTFTVYSSSETSCTGENYRVIYLTTPRKNPYHYYGKCLDNPDYYLCQKYVTFEEMPYYDFMEQVDEHIEKVEKEEEAKQNATIINKLTDFIKDNKVVFIVGGLTLIAIVVSVVVIKVRKRKKSVL